MVLIRQEQEFSKEHQVEQAVQICIEYLYFRKFYAIFAALHIGREPEYVWNTLDYNRK